jgi:hypothetical protein
VTEELRARIPDNRVSAAAAYHRTAENGSASAGVQRQSATNTTFADQSIDTMDRDRRDESTNAMNDIREMAQAFVDSWNNRELQSITQLVTTDMEFVNSLGLWWRGEAEVVRGQRI